MPVHTLEVFDMSSITTTATGGFDNNGGYQFVLGSDTVTIQPGSTSHVISVIDDADGYFDDDQGTAQRLDGDQVLSGTTYAGGSIIEAEYSITLQSAGGDSYKLQFVSVNADAFTIVGFVIQGTPPPFGEALTVTAQHDFDFGQYAYATSSPACFGPDTRIELASGRACRAATLRRGQLLRLADGSVAPLALVIRATPAVEGAAAVRFRADALGPGLPRRGMTLSAQHRVYLAAADALLPARALTELPRIGAASLATGGAFVHLVLRRHSLLLAEGVPCESFWPGEVAMRALPPRMRARIRGLMGASPQRARPFLRMQEARRTVRELARAGPRGAGLVCLPS